MLTPMTPIPKSGGRNLRIDAYVRMIMIAMQMVLSTLWYICLYQCKWSWNRLDRTA